MVLELSTVRKLSVQIILRVKIVNLKRIAESHAGRDSWRGDRGGDGGGEGGGEGADGDGE